MECSKQCYEVAVQLKAYRRRSGKVSLTYKLFYYCVNLQTYKVTQRNGLRRNKERIKVKAAEKSRGGHFGQKIMDLELFNILSEGNLFYC